MTQQMTLFSPVRHDTPTALLERALLAPAISVDCETITDPATAIAMGLPGVPTRDFGLSYNAPVSMLAVAWHDTGGISTAMLEAPFTEEGLDFIKRLMSTRHTVIAHNAIFDMRQISKYSAGKTPDQLWCTATMSRLLTPELSRYDLLSVADAYGIEYPTFMKDMKGKRGSLHLVDETLVQAYAAADAKLALQIYEHQHSLVTDEVVFGLVEWECQAVREYARMAAVGVRLNIHYVEQRIQELTTLRKEMWKQLADDGLSNPGSLKLRAKYIYQVKKIPLPAYEPMSPLFTDKGAQRAGSGAEVTLDDLSTSGEALAAISEASPANKQALKLLADYQSVDRMLSALESLQDHAATDGRVHSLISIGTTTGRRTSTHPNLQNLKTVAEPDDPAGDMAGVFVGDDDRCTLVEVDYSNAENWIAALLAGDDALANACNAEDFHSAMAERYFSDLWRESDKDERKRLRRMGKNITFGTAYGMGKIKLALTLGIAESEAQTLLDAKDRVFLAVAEAKRLAVRKAETQGVVTLWTGREILVNPRSTYTAWNYVCQGGVGEMIKRSIVQISETYHENNLHSRVALDEHDALILSVHHDEWDAAIGIASNVMEGIIPQALNERTNPPIRWIARPDFSSNQNKWGKYQWHPDSPEPDTNPAPDLAPESTVLVNGEGDINIPLHQLSVPSLGFTWQGKVRLETPPKLWTGAERREAVRLLTDLITHVDNQLRQEHEVVVPVQQPDGGIGLSQPIKVHTSEHWKVPALWLQVAGAGVDTAALIGLEASALEQLATERKQSLDKLEQVVERALEALVQVDDNCKEVQIAEVEW